ncbi:MAG: dihydrodipicolinate synthase family protein [Candidatus Solibacter usitatus]|nr:dihydrodipicolinate synthase family protein [Candidatus Solibacter usitatus]
MKLQGIFVAATTPFDHNGEVYKIKVQHNVEKWNRTTLAGYVIASSAGEGALLAHAEKLALWELAAKHSDPEKILIAASGAEGVQETVALTRHAAELGYKAAFIEAPRLYSHPENLLAYYRAVADRVSVPVIAAGIDAEIAATLSLHPNIVAAMSDTPLPAAHAGFQTVAGSAGRLWSSLCAGAGSAILAFANAAPYAVIAIWEAYRTREEDAGRDWQARVAGPAAFVEGAYGIPSLKHAMDVNGYYGGPPRLPLTVPTHEARRQIEEAFQDLRG